MTENNDRTVEWMSPETLLSDYGIKIHTQSNLRKSRQIPYSKVAKMIFYSRTKIDKWIKEGEVTDERV